MTSSWEGHTAAKTSVIINGSKSMGVKAIAVGTLLKSDPVVNPSPFPQNEVMMNIKAREEKGKSKL